MIRQDCLGFFRSQGKHAFREKSKSKGVASTATPLLFSNPAGRSYLPDCTLQLGKKVLATILEVCPLVALLLGLK